MNKLSESQEFFIDIINLFSHECDLLVNSPHAVVQDVLKQFAPTIIPFYIKIKLTENNKKILFQEIINNRIEEFMHEVRIECNGKVQFIGYDGVLYGEIYRDFNLPQDIIKKYVDNEGILMFLDS